LLLHSLGQSPQAFKYQAIVRDNGGEIIANQNVSFRISIRNIWEAGTIIADKTKVGTLSAGADGLTQTLNNNKTITHT